MNEKEMILNFPREMKIDTLKAALEQGETGIFLGLAKILLEAPLTKGGLESEIIDQVHTNFLKTIQ